MIHHTLGSLLAGAWIDDLLSNPNQLKMNTSKIFGIGLSKTATTSLNKALLELGFNAAHGVPRFLEWRGSKILTILCDIANKLVLRLNREIHSIRPWLYSLGENEFHYEELQQFDAISDLPIGIYFQELDQMFPGSKFILTIRDEEEWIESVRRHFDIRRAPQRFHTWNRMRTQAYDTIGFNEKKFRTAWNRHLKDVKTYFNDRPGDLLVVDLCKGDQWQAICGFLNCEIPDTEFPHLNQTVMK